MPESRAARLERVWYSGAAPGAGLRLLSGLFGAGVALRGALYRHGWLHPGRAGVPVIVVGNLTVGGSGKTPLVAWLVSRLAARGHRPGIASRGYGREGDGLHRVSPDDPPARAGDEALMLRIATCVPVAVAARRVEAARALAEDGCDVVVCDDGLQHLALARDLEIAVVDARRGLGNGRLLPAGPLREPPERLSRVDLVVLNGEGPAPALTASVPVARMRLEPLALREIGGARVAEPAWLAGREVHAVAGIGDPARFFAQLRALGARTIDHPFADHHRFRAEDLSFGDDRPVIMTAKDAVKCRSFAREGWWSLDVQARFDREDEERVMTTVLAALVEPRSP